MNNYFLDDNEKVLKRLNPDKFIYTLGSLSNPVVVIFMIIWTVMMVSIFSNFIGIGEPFEAGVPGMFNSGVILFTIVPFLFMLVPIGFFIIAPIYRFIQSTKTEYIITDKRVYIISGIIGTDVKSLEYREIDKLNVNVGLLDKIRGKGTIQLTPDRNYNRGEKTYVESGERLVGIEEPYEVYKLIKKNTLDVVTDQQYPNDLRPKSNKGYNTELNND